MLQVDDVELQLSILLVRPIFHCRVLMEDRSSVDVYATRVLIDLSITAQEGP